ncbi:uncharacterized protein N7498_003793 [Penicillium cinerascens]|uniref:Uncharacterized protein n=1 Tax=Penicillium cinerascens TaxID=70096 RepID=A0A9W9T777_9EURO|nr:uncharacterized protein N7498_003793 [Penicillium cinerascens]KAJ5212147.1 hypothetical protein N7498_003793 [Penicillium cinerascens]
MPKEIDTGKKEYFIPLYVERLQNYVGLDGDNDFSVVGGGHPGDYPSGAGNSTVLDVRQKVAPSLDFVMPDVTLDDGLQNRLPKHYGFLKSVSRLALDAQTRLGSSIGLCFDELAADGTDSSKSVIQKWGGYEITIER